MSDFQPGCELVGHRADEDGVVEDCVCGHGRQLHHGHQCIGDLNGPGCTCADFRVGGASDG